MSKMVKIIIILVMLVAVVALAYAVYYFSQPMPIVVVFNKEVSEAVAVETIEKYQSGIKEREHIEYDNPFFSVFYPFSYLHTITIEVPRIRSSSLGEKIKKESGVEKVIVLKHSYSVARQYKTFFESLNPRLNQ